MFDSQTSASDLLDRLRLSRKMPFERPHSMMRDEVEALARTAREHPAGSGSALALVGLVAFGLGFLAARVGSDGPVAKKRLFRARPVRSADRKRTPYYAMKSRRRTHTSA